MNFLQLQAYVRKYSCFARRKYRNLQHRCLSKLRKLLFLQQPRPFSKGFSLPWQLQNVPFTEALVTHVPIRNILAPYNASIVQHGKRFLLFFRYDTKIRHAKRPYRTSIGCIELNQKFQQTDKEFFHIDTRSDFSEDPRAIVHGDQLLLIYNDFLPKSYTRRSMHLALLNPDTLVTQSITNFHIDKKPIEKNWAPFIHENVLHFDYYLTPRKVLKVPTPSSSHVEFLKTSWQKFGWPIRWGFPRGGTPACILRNEKGGEYLSFFHSSFEDQKGVSWYVMAAYTFEAAPPFRVTAISSHPILFQGIYDSPILNTARENLRSVFPTGFIFDQDKIHISLGENDSAVKILTLDSAALLGSLRPIF